jgi:hypothetical protein
MIRRLLPMLLCATVASCNNIASPSLTSAYQYALVINDSLGNVDTLTFHWPRSFLPVRVWVSDTSLIKTYVPIAIERWQHAFLYGEYRAELVSDSAHADVIFIYGFPPDQGIAARAGQCGGGTNGPDADTHTWPLPIHIYIYSNTSTTEGPDVDTCYRITVTHELGHSLGLLAHSPLATDVMFSNPVLDGISTSDRETAETVYHVPANVVPAGRR